MLIDKVVPIRIVSSANLKEHWAKKRKREKKQKIILGLLLKPIIKNITLPVTITFTRIAPRALDIDNYQYSLKSHKDYIADLLIPGLAPGRADGDERLTFVYMQETGKPREYALKITFETKE